MNKDPSEDDNVLKHIQEEHVRQAREVLAELGTYGPDAVPLLIDRLESDKERWQIYREILDAMPPEWKVKPLTEALYHADDGVAACAAFALYGYGQREGLAFKALLARLDTEDDGLAFELMVALAEMDSESLPERLERLMQQETSLLSLRAAAVLVMRGDTPKALSRFVQHLCHSEGDLRGSAISLFMEDLYAEGYIDDQPRDPELGPLISPLLTDADPMLRQVGAICLLGMRRTARAPFVRTLIQMASDPAEDVQEAAFVVLSSTESPTSVDLFEQTLMHTKGKVGEDGPPALALDGLLAMAAGRSARTRDRALQALHRLVWKAPSPVREAICGRLDELSARDRKGFDLARRLQISPWPGENH